MPNTGVTTLATIRNTCKSETDSINSSFVSDPEWNSFIQSSYQWLYGMIVQAFGNDYFAQTFPPYQFTTDGLNQNFALPDGSSTFKLSTGATAPAFFKLLGVDWANNTTQFFSLKPFAYADRNRLSYFNGSTPQAAQNIRVHYIPRLTLPAADADLIDGVNGWEEFIVIDACIKAKDKEESDTSVLQARRAQMEQRLNSEIENRDAGNPAKIVNSMGRGALGMQYRLNGGNLWLIGNGYSGGWPIGDYGDESDGPFWGY